MSTFCYWYYWFFCPSKRVDTHLSLELPGEVTLIQSRSYFHQEPLWTWLIMWVYGSACHYLVLLFICEEDPELLKLLCDSLIIVQPYFVPSPYIVRFLYACLFKLLLYGAKWDTHMFKWKHIFPFGGPVEISFHLEVLSRSDSLFKHYGTAICSASRTA